MGLPQQTSTNPIEKPSTSETQNQTPENAPAATSNQVAGGAIGGAGATHASAEEAADRLYEERIEEEYAKREGGA